MILTYTNPVNNILHLTVLSNKSLFVLNPNVTSQPFCDSSLRNPINWSIKLVNLLIANKDVVGKSSNSTKIPFAFFTSLVYSLIISQLKSSILNILTKPAIFPIYDKIVWKSFKSIFVSFFTVSKFILLSSLVYIVKL